MILLQDKPLLRALAIFLLIATASTLVAWLIRPILLHVIFAVSWYILLQPVTGMLIRTGFSESWAALCVLAGLFLLSAISISLVFPMLIEQFAQLQAQVPSMMSSGKALLETATAALSQRLGIELKPSSFTGPLSTMAGKWSKDALFQASSLAITLLGMALIVPLLSYFLLRDYRSLRNHVMQWLPNRSFELGWIIYYRVARQLQEYVRGVLIQSGIMAMVSAIGFSILGIELAALLGLLVGILNIIPYVGPLLAMIPPCIVILGDVPVDLGLMLAAIGVILIAQVIDNTVVIPAVIANAVNLHPLTVIVGVVIFGHFFDFIGMILAIPVLSTAKILLTGLIQGLSGRSEEDEWLQSE